MSSNDSSKISFRQITLRIGKKDVSTGLLKMKDYFLSVPIWSTVEQIKIRISEMMGYNLKIIQLFTEKNVELSNKDLIASFDSPFIIKIKQSVSLLGENNQVEEEEEEEDESCDSGHIIKLDEIIARANKKEEKEKNRLLNIKRKRKDEIKCSISPCSPISFDSSGKIISKFKPDDNFNDLFVKEFKYGKCQIFKTKKEVINSMQSQKFPVTQFKDKYQIHQTTLTVETLVIHFDIINNRKKNEQAKELDDDDESKEKNNNNIDDSLYEKEVKEEINEIKKEKIYEQKQENKNDEIYKKYNPFEPKYEKMEQKDEDNILEDYKEVEDINSSEKTKEIKNEQKEKVNKEISKEILTEIKKEKINPKTNIEIKKEKGVSNEKEESKIKEEKKIIEVIPPIDRKMDYFNNIKRFFGRQSLNRREKEEIREIIFSIQDAPLPVKTSRLNVVFDLDNTLIFSNICEINQLKTHFPDVYFFSFSHKNSSLCGNFVYRPGLREFFQKIKKFCNFYVYSLGVESYVKPFVREIEHEFDIKIIKYAARSELYPTAKVLDELEIRYKDTVIIDDQNIPWETGTHIMQRQNTMMRSPYSMKVWYSQIVINSYRFMNAFYLDHDISKFSPEDFTKLNYSKLSEYFQTEPTTSPFIPSLDKNGIPYFIEHEQSSKLQFDYLGNAVEKIWKLMTNSSIQPKNGIPLIRFCTLTNCVFFTKYCCNNDVVDINNMIIACGGEITDKMDNKEISHVLIDRKGYPLFINDKKRAITEKKKYFTRTKIINPKYVFDCYYCLTRMNEDDKEYEINNLFKDESQKLY